MKLKAIQGDITTLKTDAIVNAANSSLMGGGGVDGAIHRAGGKQILMECKKIVVEQGECKPGEAVITSAGNLPFEYVIHTVGPIWKGGKNDEDLKLENCYKNSLILAIEHNCSSIAFPNISTGVYNFPKDRAAQIAVKTVKEFLSKNNENLEVIFVCYDDENFQLTQKQIAIRLESYQ
jgi:O-acetyl-ADP-ribose deacetylase (regulator of RNase III)